MKQAIQSAQKTADAPRPIEILAMSKLITDSTDDKAMIAAARSLIEPGTHDVDFTLRVRGALKVGKPVAAEIAAAADPWGLLALALSKLNGATVEALVVEHEGRLAAGEKANLDDLKSAAAVAIRRIKAATITTRNGPVSAALKIEKIG